MIEDIIKQKLNRVPVPILANDPTMVEINEPYRWFSGLYIGYRNGLFFLVKLGVARPTTVKYMGTERIGMYEPVSAMMDENRALRIIRRPKFWKSEEDLKRIARELGL